MKARRAGLPLAASIALTGIVAGAVATGAQEVLPWAGKPTVPPGDAPAAGADTAALEAAAAQCSGLFEAACRDLKTCAWIADVALQDGTVVPARCVARPPAPPKKAAKKPAPAKPKEAATPPAEGAAPAVKSSVARSEPDAEGGQAAAPAPATVVNKAPAESESAKPESSAEPKPERSAEPKAAAADPAPAPAEKKPEPAKVPIVVTPPTAAINAEADTAKANKAEAEKARADKAQADDKTPAAPSFGAISPIMPGGAGGIVTTIPRSE